MQKTITKEDYFKRINTVVEYINNNIDSEIDLEKMSLQSGFSAFHFHRIFKAIVGESLGAFIMRVRVETAARLLRYTDYSVEDIAYRIGYNTPSSLSKVFKQFYNISPTDYRNNKNFTIMRPLQLSDTLNLKEPKIVDLEDKKALYLRLTGDYSTLNYCESWKQLWGFVKENKLFSAGIEHIGIYHDDPKVTELDKLRTDVCLVIKKDATPKGVGVKNIEGGKFAVFTYIGSYTELSKVYDTIYGKWLINSGYELRLVPAFEKYVNNPEQTEPKKLKTEIYIPIK